MLAPPLSAGGARDASLAPPSSEGGEGDASLAPDYLRELPPLVETPDRPVGEVPLDRLPEESASESPLADLDPRATRRARGALAGHQSSTDGSSGAALPTPPRGRPEVSHSPSPHSKIDQPLAPPEETGDQPAGRGADRPRRDRARGRGPKMKRQPAMPPQTEAVPRPLVAERTTAIESVKNVEWPSARDILAGHQIKPRPRTVVAAARKTPLTRTKPAALPTLARVPGQWSPPVWLAGPPAAVFVLAVGVAGSFLSWRWAGDSYAASIVTDRLLTPDKIARSLPLPETMSPPDGSWTTSTAGHLARWAIYLDHFQPERAASPGETARLLERAPQVSPLDRTARLALAQREPAGSGTAVSLRNLGLSRDAVSLAYSARRLLAAGRKEAALKMYGRALAVAMPADSFRTVVPWFSDDPAVSRYLLPGEEQVRDILRELLSRSELSPSDWSGLLPKSPIVFLAAARLLRDQSPREADAMLDWVLGESSASASGEKALAVALAARAEAFALRSRWRDADRLYRQAIELVGDETIERSWWFNLADVALRLDDDDKRQAALRAAMAVLGSDDITRRAADIQRASRAGRPAFLRGQGQLNERETVSLISNSSAVH